MLYDSVRVRSPRGKMHVRNIEIVIGLWVRTTKTSNVGNSRHAVLHCYYWQLEITACFASGTSASLGHADSLGIEGTGKAAASRGRAIGCASVSNHDVTRR